jgi:hydrogenase maturation protease
VRLVLAYGNPLRRDDGVGWRIAAALGDVPGVEIECVHQLVPELASRLGRTEGVLFIDAAVGEPAGRVRVRDVVSEEGDSGFGHVLPPERLLDLADRLHGSAPPAILVTVTAGDVGFGIELSAPVQRALGPATEAARAALDALAARSPCARASSNH